MKRLAFLFALIALTVGVIAASPKGASIKFETTKVDLGQIKANGGRVTFEYPFVNDGDAPLVIVSVSNGGCGCTRPDFPKAPIKPGEKGKISITFDPTGRRGDLSREVKVRTNAKKKTVALKFKGVVIPGK